MSASSNAPAINGYDIANYGLVTANEKWFAENSGAGSAKGQTFRTGSGVVALHSVTYQVTASQQAAPTKTYVVRVGKVTGVSFTQVHTETFTQTFHWNGGEYMTWTFATPVVLEGDTTYGVDVGMTSSTSAWQTGIPYINYTASEYGAGVQYTSGTSGIGNSTLSLFFGNDRIFHLDLAVPSLPGFVFVGGNPADNSTDLPVRPTIAASFNQDVVAGTGNITITNLTDNVGTVLAVVDTRVSFTANLMKIATPGLIAPYKSYAIRIDPGAVENTGGTDFDGITDDTTWNFTTGGDPLIEACTALKNHITGAAPLTTEEIGDYSATVDAEADRFTESTNTLNAVFSLIRTYDQVTGPLWVASGAFARSALAYDMRSTIYRAMEDIVDKVYAPQFLVTYEPQLTGFMFGSSTNFPGPCPVPATNSTYTVAVNASFPDTFGRSTQDWTKPAARPTGTYLAPGTFATVTVPPGLTNGTYKIRVGAHLWDFSNKPNLARLDRTTVLYPITATETKIASPLGGGIYIEVPFEANGGIVNVTVTGAARAPYYSNTSYRQTTLTEWLDTERTQPGPWAVFLTDKTQINVPRTWIYATTNAPSLMADWDSAMDAMNDLMGFPHIQGKETMYLQADVFIRRSVFSPGYPTVNVGGANPSSDTHSGDINHYLVRGPQYSPDYVFHEQGHAYGFPKFGGESESAVNLLHVAVVNRKFGQSFDQGLAGSRGYSPSCTMSNTAILWMTSFNFSPLEQPMASWEKSYQPQGHAKYVDLARLFGWEGMGDAWYYYNSNGTSQDDDADEDLNSNDEMIFRLSKSYGRDVRPLLHFWGIFPSNPTALADQLAAEEIKLPYEIWDQLLEYKSIVPTNNATYQAFCLNWWGHQPSMGGFGVEREHARQWDTTLRNGQCNCAQVRFPTEIFDEIASVQVKARVQEIIDLYYETNPPTPNPMVFSVLPSGLNPTTVAMAGYATDVTRPVEYFFTNVTIGVGRDWSSANVWTNTGLTASASYGYMVKARDGLGNETGWSPVANAVAETDTTPPSPDPMTFAVVPHSITANAIRMTAATAADVTVPVEYLFTNETIGVGRDWSTDIIWTNTGLLADGTYDYRVKARDAIGNETAWSVLASATTEPPILRFDANGTVAGQTDWSGVWLNANQWWNGFANLGWVTGSEAIFGNGGSGGAVTLAATTAVYRITMEKFIGTYTLGSAGQTITLNAGIAMSPTSSTTTISSPLSLIRAQDWINNSGSLLTVGASVANGGYTVTVGGTGSATVSGAISGGGGLTKSGTGILTVSGGNSYGGATTVNGGVLRLSHVSALPSGPLALSAIVELAATNFARSLGVGADQVQIPGGVAGFSAQGAARFVVVSNDPNAELAWNTADFNPSTLVINHTTANNGLTLSNRLDLAGSCRTIQVGANNGTLVGAIRSSSGVAGITKTGSGTLTLTGASSFNGGLIVSQGVLAVTSDASMGDPGGEITIANNAKFQTKSVTILSARNMYIANNTTGTIYVGDNNVSSTFSNAGALSGTLFAKGQLVFGGSGANKTLILASITNDFTGSIRFENTGGSTVYVLQMNSLVDSLANIIFPVTPATFRYGAGAVEPLTLANRQIELETGNVVAKIENASASNLVIQTPLLVNGTGNKTLSLGGTGYGQFAGNIQQGSSSLGLTKYGTGTWMISGVNSYTGTTYLTEGSGPLVVAGLQALPGSSAITMRQSSSASSHLWLLDDRSGTITLPNVLTLDHGNSVLGMTIFVGNNSTNNGGTSASSRTGSTIALGKLNLLYKDNTVNLNGFANIYGANGYRLQFNAVDLPAFTSGSGAWTAHFNPTSAFVTLSGTIRPNAGSTVARTPVISLGGWTTNNVVYGSIQNAGDSATNANALGLQVIKTGVSEWVLAGTNTYTGSTTINGGTLTIKSIANVGGGGSALGAPTTIANGTLPLGSGTTAAALRYTGSGHTSDRVINLAGTTGGATLNHSGTGSWKFTSAFTATGAGKKTLVLDGSTTGVGEIAGAIIDNSISNTTTVFKVGSGKWILSGANTYRGPTTISNGTLLVHGVVSGAVTVISGGTLGGTGSVGNVTVNSGGTISPGASGGTLSVSNLTLAGTYRAETKSGSTDQIVAAGTVNLTGASLSVTNIGSVAGAQTIINKTSSGAITGQFTGWPQGAIVTNNGVKYGITYTGGDGNDVVLAVQLSAGYANWQISKFGSTNDPLAASTADPDDDGVVNLLEYAFDRDPSVSNSTPLVTGIVQRNPGDGQEYLVLTFTRRKDDPELFYTPQISTNLNVWNAGASYAELLSLTDLDATNEEVRYRMKGPISQTSRQYGRVAIALSGHQPAAAVFAVQRMILVPGQNYAAAPVPLTAHTMGGLLATNRFPAGDTEANATVVDLWDQSGQTMGTRYFHSNASGNLGWRQSGNFTNANDLALDPNKGFILTVRPGAGNATNYIIGPLPRGAQTQTVQNNGYTLAGSRFPVAVSPANANLTGSGFVGGTSLVTSDNLLIFNPVTQQFDIKLWYYTIDGTWRDHTGVVATQQLQPGAGFLIKRRNRAGGNFTWTNSVPYDVSEVWP